MPAYVAQCLDLMWKSDFVFLFFRIPPPVSSSSVLSLLFLHSSYSNSFSHLFFPSIIIHLLFFSSLFTSLLFLFLYSCSCSLICFYFFSFSFSLCSSSPCSVFFVFLFSLSSALYHYHYNHLLSHTHTRPSQKYSLKRGGEASLYQFCWNFHVLLVFILILVISLMSV